MKTLFIINTPSLPISGNFWHTVRKFTSGFSALGFDVVSVNNEEGLSSIADDEDNFFFIGDHGLYANPYPQTIESLKKFPKTTKIHWAFHDFLQAHPNINLGKWILTCEHFHKTPSLPGHLAVHKFHLTIPKNYQPLTFLSFLKIEQIGTFKRNETYDAQFVGAGYKTDWTSKLKNCFIHHTPPEISEAERVNSFLNSFAALGFSSEGNIQNGTVTERVAEGLSFGNVVISDNPTATEWTDGIVEYASCFEELSDKIAFFVHNKQAFKEKQTRGYEWAKNKGTYTHLAMQFVKKSKEI